MLYFKRILFASLLLCNATINMHGVYLRTTSSAEFRPATANWFLLSLTDINQNEARITNDNSIVLETDQKFENAKKVYLKVHYVEREDIEFFCGKKTTNGYEYQPATENEYVIITNYIAHQDKITPSKADPTKKIDPLLLQLEQDKIAMQARECDHIISKKEIEERAAASLSQKIKKLSHSVLGRFRLSQLIKKNQHVSTPRWNQSPTNVWVNPKFQQKQIKK